MAPKAEKERNTVGENGPMAVAEKKPKEEAPSMAFRDKKKRKKRRVESYNIYIYKVLKEVHPHIDISCKAMAIMNSFMSDLFKKLATKASILAKYSKIDSLTSREFQIAAKLVFPKEIAKHVQSVGHKVVVNYCESYGR